MERISNILFHWGVNKVVIESNFGDGIWTKLLIPILKRPVEIKEYRATGQKELRILDALQPLTENHRLVIDPSVAKNESFGFQYTRLSRDRGSLKHDDIIDAIAIGVEDLKEYVAVDPTTMARRKAEKEQQKEIKDFLTAFKKQERNVGEREGRHSFTSMNRSPRSGRGWGRMPR